MTILINQFKTIIFDLDGPLLDGKLRHYECYSDILQNNGFVPINIEKYWFMKRQRIDRHTLLAYSDATELYELFLQEWLDSIERRSYLLLDRLQPKIIELLSQLQQAKIQLILVTMRSHHVNLYWQLKHFGLDNFFSNVLAVNHYDKNKSKAAAVSKLISGTNPLEYLWVGDTEIDIHAARELGVRVAALNCGLRTKKYLNSLGPDFLCNDLLGLMQFDNFLLTERIFND